MREKINIILEMKKREKIDYSYEEKLLKEIETLKKAVNMDNENLKNMFTERIKKGIEDTFKEESSQTNISGELKYLLKQRKIEFDKAISSEDFVSAAIKYVECSERTIEYETAKENSEIIDIPHITYQGVLISEESKNEIKKQLQTLGIEIKNNEPKNMHITYQYFSKEDKKEDLLFGIENIGKEVSFKFNKYGEYEKDGKLANQGLLMDMSSLSDNNLKNFLKNEKPHLTLSVNNEKIETLDKKGKIIKIPFSTAKETPKATFNIPIEIEISGKTAYFSDEGVHYRLEEDERNKALNSQINKEIDNYIENKLDNIQNKDIKEISNSKEISLSI